MVPKITGIEICSPGVNVAVVKKDDDGWKFLVLQRAEKESYPGCWGLLTGLKEGHESAAQIAVREMKEETGLKPDVMWSTETLIQFYEPEFDQIWLLPLIVAVVPSDSRVVLTPENAAFKWLDPFKAKKQVTWKNLVAAVDQVAEELEVYPARTWVQVSGS
jgi:dihydroneopterin triphosphate diphosphatase